MKSEFVFLLIVVVVTLGLRLNRMNASENNVEFSSVAFQDDNESKENSISGEDYFDQWLQIFEDGKDEETRRNSCELLKKGVELDSAECCNALGVALANGDFIEKDLESAFELFQKAADHGYGDGLCNAGICLLFGLGTDKNPQKGFELIQQGAESGSGLACDRLAMCYKYGVGVKSNSEESLKWLSKGIELGDPCAYYDMGVNLLLNESRTDDSLPNVIDYFERSAENGIKEAFYQLGQCCECGLGCKKDEKKAVEYYQKGEKQNDSDSCFALAMCYYEGIGVPKNKSKAEKLFIKSANLGNQTACGMLASMYKMRLRFVESSKWEKKRKELEETKRAYVFRYSYRKK